MWVAMAPMKKVKSLVLYASIGGKTIGLVTRRPQPATPGVETWTLRAGR
jgi:hypothetical protein